jgi:carbon storage regulator
MLVLTRKLNESIMIGDDVEICLLEIKGDRIRLGIKAPRSVPVHRKEVYEEIKRANEEAARSSVENVRAIDELIGERGRADGDGGEG